MIGPLLVVLILVGGAAYLLINFTEDKAMPSPEAPADPQMVTADELFKLWMSPEGVGLEDDPARKLRIVHMADGSTYAAHYADVRAQQVRHNEECPICKEKHQ